MDGPVRRLHPNTSIGPAATETRQEVTILSTFHSEINTHVSPSQTHVFFVLFVCLFLRVDLNNTAPLLPAPRHRFLRRRCPVPLCRFCPAFPPGRGGGSLLDWSAGRPHVTPQSDGRGEAGVVVVVVCGCWCLRWRGAESDAARRHQR